MSYKLVSGVSRLLAQHLRHRKQQLTWMPLALLTSATPRDWLTYRPRQEHRRQRANNESMDRLLIGGVLWASSAFTFNFFKTNSDVEETPQDKLIMTIKRSLLCIQQEQYDKAEQMLHLALRMAQELQSHEGITYIYDVMANLAMEREQYKKADKLFADVMKRLMNDGFTEHSPQILHISAKLAHMAQLQGDLEKSMQGFKWTLSRIEGLLRQTPDDKNVQELLGLTKNWYCTNKQNTNSFSHSSSEKNSH